MSAKRRKETGHLMASRLFQILICVVLLCGALYIRYRQSIQSIPTFAAVQSVSSAGLTLTDLADDLYKKSGLAAVRTQDRNGVTP